MIASKVYFNPGRLSREAIHREIDGPLPPAAIKNIKSKTTQKSRVKAEKTKIFFQKVSSGFGDVSFKERSGRFKA